MKISLVVPVYNESDNVNLFYKEAIHVLTSSLSHYDWEIIYIDDGSADDTYEKISQIAHKEERVKVLHLSRNFGHQAALTAGLSYATGDAIVSLDVDLQDPPSLIPQMVEEWKKGNNIVYARRKNRSEGFFKKYTAILYYKLLSYFSAVDIPRNVGDFRLIDKTVLRYLLRMHEKARYLRGMVSWLGFTYTFVDFDRPNRMHGETKYSLRKMFQLAMDGILNFSFLPLRIGFLIGIFVIFSSLFFLLYIFLDTVVNDTYYPLYKWLSVFMFSFIGLQFIFIWILGEYVGRIYDDVRKRPLYIVNKSCNISSYNTNEKSAYPYE